LNLQGFEYIQKIEKQIEGQRAESAVAQLGSGLPGPQQLDGTVNGTREEDTIEASPAWKKATRLSSRVDRAEVSSAGRSERGGRRRGEGQRGDEDGTEMLTNGGGARLGGDDTGFGQWRLTASDSGVRLRTAAVTWRSNTAGREAGSGGSDCCCRDGAAVGTAPLWHRVAWQCGASRWSGARCVAPGRQCHPTNGPSTGLRATDKWVALNSFSKSNLNAKI
jgi:hypothetical protein